MNIEKILESWDKDSKINQNKLDDESARSPLLHSKYLQIMTQEKGRLIMYEMEQKKLLKKKWLYYNGKMTQEEIEAEGWEFDPFDGLKVLKGEMNFYYDADDDIQKSEIRIQLQKEKINVLKEIIDNIKWRHQTFKNMIEWRKFEAGI